METVTMQAALRNDGTDSKTVETELNRTALFSKKQGMGQEGPRRPLAAANQGRAGNVSSSSIFTQPGQGMLNRPGQSRPGSRPDTIRRPNGGMMRFNGTRMDSRGGRIGPYPLRRVPFGKYSVEVPGGKKPSSSQESGQEHSIPRDRTKTLEKLVDGSHSVKNVSEGSLSKYQPITSGLEKEPVNLKRFPESSQTSPLSSEEPLEPTITTERNLTAHVNGTKCVRKVLVGHRKIHFNGTSGEKPVTKDLTVIVGHVNGNDLIQKLLLGSSEGLVQDVTSSSIEAKLQGDQIETRLMERIGGDIKGDEKTGGMGATSLPASYAPESFLENVVMVSSQSEEEEVGTSFQPSSPYSTPPPLPPQVLPISQSILLPTERQKDKNPTTASQKMPPPQRRFPNRPISSGSSISGMKRAPSPSVTLKDTQLSINDQFVPLEREVTSVHSAEPALTELQLMENTTDTENTKESGDGGLLKNEQTMPRNGNLPPFRRTPFRGTFPRRPNTAAFQNRTRPMLRPPQYPNRSLPLRPIIEPRVPDMDNSPVTQTTPYNQAEPETNSQISQSGMNPKTTFTFRRRNGPVRPPTNLNRHQRPNATNIHSGSQDNTLETKGKDSKVSLPLDENASKVPTTGLPTDIPLTTDKPSVPTNDRFQDVAGESEDGTDRILSRAINKDNITVWQTVPHDRVKPEIISGGSQNSSNRNLKPNLTVRSKNGTFVRLSPKRPQIKPIKPKAPINHGDLQVDKRAKGSPADLSIYKDAREGLGLVSGKGTQPKHGLIMDTEARIDKSERLDSEPVFVTDEGTGQDHKPVTETVERQDHKLGLVIDEGSRQHHRPSFVTEKGSRQDPKLGLVTDKGTRQDARPGLVTEKGTMQDPKLPPVTVKVANQGIRLSNNKTSGKSKGIFDFVESEDGIDHVGVQKVTSKGFLIIWASPRGMFQNFVISVGERGKGGIEEEKADERDESPNILGSSPDSHTVSWNSSDVGLIKKFTKVLPGSARSYPVSDLTPQTGYSVSLFGKGPGLRSNIHSFIIRTGTQNQ